MPPIANSPARAADLANSESRGAASFPADDSTATSDINDSESDSDSEGWVALEDLPLYNSNGITHFHEDGVENGHSNGHSNGTTERTSLIKPPSMQTWRADFDDLKPSSDESAVPFDLNPDQLNSVKVRMQNINIEYKPDWAETVEETAWRQQLQNRLEGREAKG